MGDSGSIFIGLILGLLSIKAAWVSSNLFFGMLILLGMFVIDSTVTLFRRVYFGYNFYEAHRSHAYQFAARKYKSHVVVAMFFVVVNICWLLPIACVVVKGWINAIIGITIAYIPLIYLAIKFKAGHHYNG